MLAWLAPVAVAALTPHASGQASDPLATGIFEICPALLAETLSEADGAKLESFGFRFTKAENGHSYLASPQPFDVLIEVPIKHAGPRTTCPVYLMNGTQQERHARLVAVLKTKGLEVKEIPSPIGGGLINATRPDTGKLVTTSQESDDSILTLVPGA